MAKSVSTYFGAQQWAFLRLQQTQQDPDTARWLMLRISHLNQTHLLMAAREKIPEPVWQAYQAAVQQVAEGNPPQYVLGQADFYGLTLKVTPAVLIPRVETAELVDWVLSEHDQRPIRVLDLGTGSGAIALALKSERPEWQVTASDVSGAALKVASTNAQTLGLALRTIESNLFARLAGQQFDVIVSNPPYIDHLEEPVMDQSVIQHEPHLALFAQHHGLAIYERIAETFQPYLAPKGSLYLEIGYRQGKAVSELFKQQQRNVVLKQDLAQHDRMIRVD